MVQGKIIKRLLGQPLGDSSSEQAPPYEPHRDEASLLRPTSSQYASLRVASPITCLDKSPHGSHAVVAGEEVFKTIKVDGSSMSEETDLRAAIASQVSHHDNALSTFKDQLNIKSVKWSHTEMDTTIVTASANGRVTLYDLNRVGSGVEVARISEHLRQVHRLAINPFRGNWLLSASQDGTARLFDLRAASLPGNALTFKSWSVFKCNADAVRDIKWSPTAGFKFACSTASGTVLYWDSRRGNAPLLKINAHDSACMSISWHPDGEHLISGGLDQQCYVWDLSEKAEKRQKPKYAISTPAPISIVSWRPPTWSSSAQARRAAQAVVVYDDTNSMRIQNSTVHIWDMARPSLPFREITDFDTSPTGLLWHERDLLWTVGREGNLTQTDVAFAPKVIDRRSLSTFDFNASGDVLMLLEERQSGLGLRLRPQTSGSIAGESHSRPVNTEPQSQSPGAGQLSLSRSDSEEDLMGSFLGNRPRSKRSGQRHSNRSTNPLSTTPPTASSKDGNVMKLDDAVKLTGLYKPQQIMAVGHAPSAARKDVFYHLSSRYLQRMARDIRDAELAGPEGPSISERVTSILEYFARSAEGMNQFRMAQTWRIFSYTMGLLLSRRAEYHLERRLKREEEKKVRREKEDRKVLEDTHIHSQLYPREDILQRRLQRPKSPQDGLANPIIKSIITEEIESTSNVTTPQARPVRDSLLLASSSAVQIFGIEGDRFQLPPAIQASTASPLKISKRAGKEEEPVSSLEGYDFYGMDGLTTPAIDIAAPPRKAPFRLDMNFREQELTRGGSLARHDSNESFQMFSTSSESQSRKFPSSSQSPEHAILQQPPHRSVPEVDSSWDSSATSSQSRPNRSFESDDVENYSGKYDYNSPEPSQLPPTLRIHRASPDPSRELEDQSNEFERTSAEPPADEQEDLLKIRESDYLPSPSEPLFLPGPLDPHLLIQRMIQFETQTGSLNASIMVLLLKPLLAPGTIDDIQAAALLRQLHHRLDTMQLFPEATLLRNLCYPLFPSVYSQGQPKNIGSMGYYCTTCEKPVKEGDLVLGQLVQKCHRCKTYFAGCAVCNEREEPLLPTVTLADTTDASTDIIPAARLWWWCQGCGHGGHTVCMHAWHASDGLSHSDGACPLDGCVHPCLPGKARVDFFAHRGAARNEELTRLVKEVSRGGVGPGVVRVGGVIRDRTEVGESRAVESVRGVLGSVVGGVGTAGVERRRSVKGGRVGEK